MAAKILACNDPLGIRQHCYQHEAGLHQKRWKANGVDLISDPVTVMESGVGRGLGVGANLGVGVGLAVAVAVEWESVYHRCTSNEPMSIRLPLTR